MKVRSFLTLFVGVLLATALSCTPPMRIATAQEVNVAGDAQATTDIFTRGPVHEAFATPIRYDPQPSPVVPKQPPEPIDEVPPEVKPEGDSVQWIPGYWSWDDEQEDFIWISGLWRTPPPGHRWVPGYWNEAEGGYRWMSGAWVSADAGQVAYQPTPPKSQERGPTSPQPSKNHFWVPGCWEYHDSDYQWRPGYWAPHQYGWAWTPAHYRPAAHGVIFVDGYWDYRPQRRGQLFAPVRFRSQAYASADFRYRPHTAIDSRTQLLIHLWTRPDRHHYYFGDYYGEKYAKLGFQTWFDFHASGRGYDPMLAYAQWHFSNQGIDFVARLKGWHGYFLNHVDVRPRHTLAETLAFAESHADYEFLAQSVIGSNVDSLLSGESAGRFVRLASNQLNTVGKLTDQIRGLGRQRLDVEQDVSGALNLPRHGLDLPDLPAGIRTPAVGRNVPRRAFDLRNTAPQLPAKPTRPLRDVGDAVPGLPF